MTRGKTLLVLRHGQTEHNASGIYQGQTDTELSATGREQAVIAGAALALRRPRRIVCSDLRRARATAEAVAAACGGLVDVDPALREIDVGAWAGLTHHEVSQRYPDEVQAMIRGEDVRRGRSGETVDQVATRTARVAAATMAQVEDSAVVVLVGHGFASRAMTARLLGWSSAGAYAELPGLDNCHWGELAWQPDGWMLTGWNISTAATSTH